MERRFVAIAVTAAFVGGLALSGLVEQVNPIASSHAVPPAADSATATIPAAAAPLATLPDFSALVEREGAAVVNIAVSKKMSAGATPQGEVPPGMDPFEFFRRFGPQRPPQPGGPGVDEPQRQGNGSGFIVSPDGYVLTNTHVVKDADQVTVTLTDRREFTAKVIGTDDRTDVALIKIEASGLPTVRIGDPAKVKVGNWVAAIGSPFGLENTVTAGIVSAKSRTLPSDAYVPFIQTDVAVNPGNSGGPLFNTHGEVIGINSQIFSHTGGYQGLSFAIPIDVAERVRDQIATTGKVVHGKLGVTVQEMNQTLADSFKLPKAEGALVSTVERDGPAARAGLKAGDVILKVNGRAIVASGDLPALVGQGKPGDRLAMEVSRQGKPIELTATLGDAAEKSVAAARDVGGAGQGKLGLALRPLQSEEKREAGVQNGLVVEDAVGPSANAGVMPGDVLLSVNGAAVSSVEQVRELVSKAGKSVALLIQRDGNQIFIPIRIG